MLYLLQLVQALKYEDFDEILAAYSRESAGEMSGLGNAIHQQQRQHSIHSDTSDTPHVDR